MHESLGPPQEAATSASLQGRIAGVFDEPGCDINEFDVTVCQTCETAMIGDDIEVVCKRASEKFG